MLTCIIMQTVSQSKGKVFRLRGKTRKEYVKIWVFLLGVGGSGKLPHPNLSVSSQRLIQNVPKKLKKKTKRKEKSAMIL